jgi:hypothetical protein
MLTTFCKSESDPTGVVVARLGGGVPQACHDGGNCGQRQSLKDAKNDL